MSPTSDDSSTESGGARLRAKARVGAPRVRPEVTDALSGLERSLVDVATWERLQPSPVDLLIDEPGSPADPSDAPDDAPPADPDDVVDEEEEEEEDVPIVVGEIPPPPGAPDAPPGPPPIADVPVLPPEMIVDLEPRSDPTGLGRAGDSAPAGAATAPLLTEFLSGDSLDALRLDGPVLPSATGVAAGYTQADAEAEEAERRRRNGRVLTWAGVVVLAAVALLWLVPDRSGDDPSDELPAVEETTSTSGGLLLDPNELTTTTTEATTTIATAVTAPNTSATTARGNRPTGTTPRSSSTTSGAPTTTLALPTGPTTTPSSVRPPTSSTSTPPPTTTPPTSTTAPE